MTLEIIRASVCFVTVKREDGELEAGMVDAAEVGQIVTIITKGEDSNPVDVTGEVVLVG